MDNLYKKDPLTEYCELLGRRLIVGLSSTAHLYPVNPKTGRGHYIPRVRNSRNTVTIELRHTNPNNLTRIEKNIKELSMWAGLSNDDSIRLFWAGNTVKLEIPKPKPFRQPVTIEELKDYRFLKRGPVATLGVGPEGEAIRLDFRDPAVAHVYMAGQTRSGKTNTQLLTAWNLARNEPTVNRLLIFDVAKRGYKWDVFNHSLSLLYPVITDEETAILALKRVVLELRKRAMNKIVEPKWFIIIDELASLVHADQAVIPLLSEIAAVGGEFGIHMIFATQYPQVNILKEATLKRNVTVRLCGRVDDAQASSNALGEPGAGAEKLRGSGDFLLKDLDDLKRITVCLIEPSHFDELPRGEVSDSLTLKEMEIGDQRPEYNPIDTDVDPMALAIAIFEDFGVNKIQKAVRDKGSSLSAERGMFHRKLAQEVRRWATEIGYDCL